MYKDKNEFINKIVLKLVKYEPERLKRLSKLRLQFLITIIVAVLMVLSNFIFRLFSVNSLEINFIGLGTHFIFMLLMMVSVIFVYLNYSCNKGFKKYLKENCQTDILQTFNLQSIKEEGFSEALLQRSNLFSDFDSVVYDDVITGNYNDVDYTIAETLIQHNGSEHNHKIFKGVIISFQSNKKIVADTLIVPKGAKKLSLSAKFALTIAGIMTLLFAVLFFINGEIVPAIFFSFSIVALIVALCTNKYKMQRVKLEDVDFAKQFDVHTQDQVEARYLLTPTFMERLKSLETSFGTKGIKCSFFHDQIMIAIPIKKDLFEVGSVYHSLGSTKLIEEFYDEITSIQNMIDHFKLAEKTGL